MMGLKDIYIVMELKKHFFQMNRYQKMKKKRNKAVSKLKDKNDSV